MLAMRLTALGTPLSADEVPTPVPGPGQILVQVRACGVCRTDLHLVDGELPHPELPIIPGHEIVGIVKELGSGVDCFALGDRVGIPWLGWTCATCEHCLAGRENLCQHARFTGYQLDGGYSQFTVADSRYAFPLPASYGDAEAAPLLCAGLIGYRAWARGREARRLGLYGFGAAAHIVAQLASHAGQRIFAFTRPGDEAAQVFARRLGAEWAGGSEQPSPDQLDAAILFAPVGALVPAALGAVRPGGSVICAGIHMSDIPTFPYQLLWGERSLVSIANLTRRDGEEFLALAPRIPVVTEIERFPLEQANLALSRLRGGQLQGAAVLIPPP